MKRYLLPISFSLIIFLMIGVAMISILRMSTISDRMENLVNEHNVKVSNIMTMYVAARERSLSLLKMLSLEDPFEREEEFDQFNEYATEFAVARIALLERENSPKELELIEKHLEYVKVAVPLQLQVVDSLFNEQFEEAEELLINEAIPAQNSVLDQLTRMLNHQDSTARESLIGVDKLNRNTSQFVYLLTIISVLLSSAIAIYVVRALKKDEAELQKHKDTLEARVKERTKELRTAFQDLKKSQAQLVQSEKMASLGQLTAGIAHEIKNPLNFINNFSETSLESSEELKRFVDQIKIKLSPEELEDLEELIADVGTDLEKIKSHGERADGIVRSMLLHSRDITGEYNTVDINPLAEESLNLAYHSERARDPSFNVKLNRDLWPEPLMVKVDSLEISRVFINLISNGFYATQIKTREVNGDYQPEITVKTYPINGNVGVAISDNGLGIKEDQLDKIFEPFYTTKPTGEGTGLGLSMSYDIVTKQYGGDLQVTSSTDQGTTFVFSLKVVK